MTLELSNPHQQSGPIAIDYFLKNVSATLPESFETPITLVSPERNISNASLKSHASVVPPQVLSLG